MADTIRQHINETEWVGDEAGLHWFNSYYDNSGRQAEGLCGESVRMMLTGQVFTLLSGTADGGLMPEELTPHALPLFREGPVHWMKLPAPLKEKRAMAKQIRESGLYDKELDMYKVNESLKDVSYEAGRAKAFSAGWLENVSFLASSANPDPLRWGRGYVARLSGSTAASR